MRPVIATLLLLCCAFPVMAETYSWVDSEGTVNFTDEYTNVPAKYRKKAIKRSDMNDEVKQGSPEQQKPVESAVEKKSTEQAKPAAGNTGTASVADGGIYGGKKMDEWKQELRTLENEVKRLEALTKEAEAVQGSTARSGGYSREDLQRQNERQAAAIDAYNAAVDRHSQFVESARKAGVPFKEKK